MKAIIILEKDNKNLISSNLKTPNALINFFDKPILEHTINLLKKNNIIDIAILIHYSSQEIKNYFETGSNLGVSIRYFNNKTSIQEIKEFLGDESFLVINELFLTNITLNEAIEFHINKQCMATALVTDTAQIPENIVIQCGKDDEVIDFFTVIDKTEKFSKNISTGIFILDIEFFEYTNNMPKDILKFLLKENIECYIIKPKGSWYSIGVLEQYLNCNKVFENNPSIIKDNQLLSELKFSNDSIIGNCSQNLSPSMAIKIGEIFGSPNAIIGVFSDDNSASDMISNAIISGLKSVGTIVYEYPNTISPLCNIACTYYTLSRGLFIYTDGFNTVIEFLDKDGSRIDINTQKQIENSFYNNEQVYVSPNEIAKSIKIHNYKFHYYSEIIKRLNDDPIKFETNIILEKTSESILEYIRKIAICYKVNLIPIKKASNYSCMKINIHPAGKKITLWDETGYMLTERQIEAIIAKIICDEKITNSYVTSSYTSQAIKAMLEESNMNILETNSHISYLTKAMLSIVDKEQFLITNDQIYFIFKLINYLNKKKIKLYTLLKELPKTYFIEKTSDNKSNVISHL
jgi:NDP-sugar pyrophosphorylase family protein/tRNA(Phe) wybutosine-synthesizing methylase Tyw3